MIGAWLDGLWAASVRGGIALLIVWVLCHIRRLPAMIRCWMWCAAYAMVLTSLVWTTPMKLPLLRATAISPAQNRINPAPPVAAAMQRSEPLHPDPILMQIRPAYAATSSIRPSNHLWSQVAFALWLGFLASYAIRLVIGWLRARRLRDGMLLDPPELTDLCQRMNIRRTPIVRTTSAVRGPLLVGLWRPMILLPESTARSDHIRLVLAHELAHLKRMDLLWNWLPTLAMAALPLHPMVWICKRQWRLASEAACDAEAIVATAFNRLSMAVC